MAQAEKLMPHVKQWEGRFSNNPLDAGGPTMYGVTLATFRKFYGADATVVQLKLISDTQWLRIFRAGYWDKCRADEIASQSVADAIVDWAYNSGTATAAKKVQAIVGVVADGVIGPVTLAAINRADPRRLFGRIQTARIAFVEAIVRNNPKQSVFLAGWKNRINALKFVS